MESFLCVCGRQAEPPLLAEHPWARYVGYGDHGVVKFCIDQSQAAAAAPDPNLLETCPKPQDRCWARLRHPFVLREASFWCVYMTPMMVWNGAEPDGDELESFALVECRLLKVEDCLASDREKTLAAEVEVLTVVTLKDLVHQPLGAAPVSGDAARQLIQNDANLDRLEPAIWQGHYAYVAATEHEADWGQWAILHRSNDEIDLLVSGHWGLHYDHVWAGRVRLTALPDHLQAHLSRPEKLAATPPEAPARNPTTAEKRSWFDIRFEWPKGRW